MFKYVKAFFKGLYKILLSYPKIQKYYKHKDKYPIEERYAYARKLVGILMKSFGVEVEQKGIKDINVNGSFMIVCNHQGFMDALTLVYLFEKPVTFVAKIEAKKYLIVGKIMSFIDTIFIDRSNIKDAVKMVRTCKECLNNGRNICIFPEGTRTRDENRLPIEYKAGAFKPAYETNKPIVALVMNGGYKVFSKKYKKDIKITVEVMDIIDSETYKEKNTTQLAKEIEDKTREIIKKICKQ